MQKIINGIAIFSGAVALGVVGLGGYVFIRKDAIIDNVKSKIMESVLPGGIGGALGGGGLGLGEKGLDIPSVGLPSPSTPTPDAPATGPVLPLGF
tara:strand:- start:72 stop:356 length:285 start_codon:yes stop_codon:yes gene_type:complete